MMAVPLVYVFDAVMDKSEGRMSLTVITTLAVVFPPELVAVTT